MFQGSMVALVTPMKTDGTVDDPALEALIEWHLENKTDAIVAVGTTGESATLGFEEHCEVMRRMIEMVHGRVPVICGTGANATTEAIRLTQCAKEAGADACLLVTPYYNKPTQEGLFKHFQAIARQVAIPQILYNVPGRTAVDMAPETVARLVEEPNIIGIKEALGKVDRIRDLVAHCGEHFAIFSGDDATGCDSILAGGKGVISVTANVAPRLMHEMCAAALSGDADQAHELDSRLEGLHKALFVESNPIPVKWAMHQLGKIDEGIRLPLTWLSPDKEVTVRRAMEDAGISLNGE